MLSGAEKFREKTGFSFYAVALIKIILAVIVAYLIALTGSAWAWWPVLIQAVIAAGWLYVFKNVYLKRRTAYAEKYKERAYKAALIHFLMPLGVFFLAGAALPLFVLAGSEVEAPLIYLSIIAGLFLFLVGFHVFRRTIADFGVDRMLLVYSIEPEGDAPVKSGFYAYLRHPLYFSLICFTWGGALVRGYVVSLVLALIFTAKIYILHLWEEDELTERFGDIYELYKQEVPALFPPREKLGEFFHSLFK